jgi:undecaprenyl diphosphate synthase
MITSDSPIQHLAIIPDGNRRWAKKHAITGGKIYEKGSNTTFEIIKTAFEQDVPYVTFWGSSYANLQERAKGFVGALEELTTKKFVELTQHPLIHEYQVHVTVLGEWRDLMKPKSVATITEAIKPTANYQARQLTILLGYDGQRERGTATTALLAKYALGNIPPETDIIAANQLLRAESWTGHLPDVDLILRTGAWDDPHNSAGFLGFLNAESQFSFPKVLWPDLTPAMLQEILQEASTRERRKGK